MTKEKFNELTADQQIMWLVNLTPESKSKLRIVLDNDCTQLIIDETDTCFYPDADFGNRDGVYILLEQLGFNVEYC